MRSKKLLITIVKSLIILLVASLIFSTITFNVPLLIKQIFEDIFTFANPEAQREVINKLTDTCSSLDKGYISISQICTNKTLLESMKERCKNYRDLIKRGVRIENEAEIMENCAQIESGELEVRCLQIQKSSLLPDFNKIGTLCKEYRNEKINDKEFFYGVMSSPLSGQMNLTTIGLLDKYNKGVNLLTKNKIFYLIILIALFIVLYLLLGDVKLYYLTLAEISLSIGILITVPYFGILLYEKFVGIDTTPILFQMLGLGTFKLEAFLSIFVLLLMRTYNTFIIITGIIFLAAGLSGRIYTQMLKRKQINIKRKKT